jgi:PIN domain nuclease of toxin-antitoxin system
MKRFVFDTTALLAFLEDRDGATEVERLFREAIAGRAVIIVPASSWGETVATLHTRKGDRNADAVLNRFANLPLEFVDLDLTAAENAGRLAARQSIPFTVAACAAVAKTKHAVLVIADPSSSRLSSYVKTVIVGSVSDKEV